MHEQSATAELAECVESKKEAAGCGYINDYCQRRHNSVVRCLLTTKKGRILRSGRSFEQGEIIFQEPPLHIVSECSGPPEIFAKVKELCKERPQVFIFQPLWYWAALCSLKPSLLTECSKLPAVDEDTHKKLLLLYSMEVSKASEASKVLVEVLQEMRCDPLDLERLLQVWILNCFEHTDEPLGYSTYFMSSFMSHSCYPNAVWHYVEDNFVLRAREKIEADEEITVSYLGEENLLEAATFRRKHLLDSKHFICDCLRCTADSDPCRGFRCPRCSSTSLKLGACCDQVDVRAEEMTGRKCEQCGHALAAGEAAMLIGEETLYKEKLQEMEDKLVRLGEGKPDKELIKMLSKSLRRAEKSLAQHYLLDRSFQLLADLCLRHEEKKDGERYMRKRLEYQVKAYPAISGCYAWTAEAYADMLIRHAGGTSEPKVPEETAKLRGAAVVYKSCVDTLRVMFGEEHEFFQVVNRKAQQLNEELTRLGSTS